MSNEENKITTVEKSAKVKDPRKVELGKRLAKISREAKERKARQRKEAETEAVNQREITDYIDFRYFIGGLYYSYKKDKREEKEIVNNVKEENSRVSEASASDKFKKFFMYINKLTI